MSDETKQLPFDPYDRSTWPRVAQAIGEDRTQREGQTEINNLRNEVARLQGIVQTLVKNMSDVWPPRASAQQASDSITDIRYNSSTHAIETTSDGAVWTSKISFAAQTMTLVTSNSYDSSTHKYNYLTKDFTAYLPEAINASGTTTTPFVTLVSGSCT